MDFSGAGQEKDVPHLHPPCTERQLGVARNGKGFAVGQAGKSPALALPPRTLWLWTNLGVKTWHVRLSNAVVVLGSKDEESGQPLRLSVTHSGPFSLSRWPPELTCQHMSFLGPLSFGQHMLFQLLFSQGSIN